MTRGDTRRALSAIWSGLRQLLAVRWIRWSTLLLLAALGVRAGMGQLMGYTLTRLAAERGLTCSWEVLNLSVLSGRCEVHAFVIQPLPDEAGAAPDPLLDMEYAVFDLNIAKLLRGDLSVTRAEVDGFESWWIREANGEWNVGQHVSAVELLALLESTPEEEVEPDKPESGELNLSSPIAVEALRFQNATYRIIDRTQSPPVEFKFQVDAALSYLNSPDRPLGFSASILGDELFDAAHISGVATWSDDEILLKLQMQAGSVHPRLLERYLVPQGIRPSAESIQARLHAEIRLAVTCPARDELEVRVGLSDIHVTTDGAESMALDHLRLELDSVSGRGATLTSVELKGIRGRASLESDSSLRLAGLDIFGTRWAESISELVSKESDEEVQPEAFPSWLSLLFTDQPAVYPLSFGSLEVREGLIEFTDRTVEPPSTFPLIVDEIQVGDKQQIAGSVKPTIPVRASLRAPGMAETIELKGELGPFAPQRSVDLDLQVDGIGLASLEPHMRRAGMERALEQGSFHARLIGEALTDANGRTEGHLRVEQVALEDGEQIFGVSEIRGTGLVLDPGKNLLRLGDLEIAGSQITLGRDPSRRFFAVGLRTLGFVPVDTVSSAPALEAPESNTSEEDVTVRTKQRPARIPPRIEFGRLALVDSDVKFVDQSVEPPLEISIERLAFELTNMTLGGDPAGPAYEPASFSMSIAAPGVIDGLRATGQIHSRPGPVDLELELELRGQGGTGALIRPYLRALGVEPAYNSAVISADVSANLKREAAGWLVGLSLRDASLHDSGREVLAVEEIRVDELRLGDEISASAIRVRAPRASAGRDETGHLIVAGVRLLSSEPQPTALDTESAPLVLAMPELPVIRVQSFQLEQARLVWNDAAIQPAIATELVLDVSATELSTDGSPAAFEVHLHVPETLERLTLHGSLTLGPQELSVRARIDGEGVRPGPLAQLLPAGVELESSAAHLQGAFEASVQPAADGGLQVNLLANDFAWGEPDAEPWFAVQSAQLRAPRIDLEHGVVQLGPITVKGVMIEAEQDAGGALHLLGLGIGLPGRSLPTDARPEVIASNDKPGVDASSAPLVLPRIELVDEVTLQLARARVRSELLGADAQAFEADATFRLETPLLVVDPDGSPPDPIRWQVDGSIAGLVERWVVRGEVTPFADEPKFEGSFQASGVRTAGVLERAPRFAGLLEGELEEGTLAAAMHGTLYLRRSNPTDLGLSRPFRAELEIEGVEYRDRPGGTVLAGVDRITAEFKRVDLKRGIVHVDTLEVQTPRGALWRKDMTVRALGFAVHLDAEPLAAPATDAAIPESTTEARAVQASAALDETGPASKSELRIDHLSIQGLDFTITDETSDPPVRIPLKRLDAELERFTTRTLVEKRPFHFSGYLESGDEHGTVFEEVALAGRLALYPAPDGWVQLSVSGLELPTLAPMAAANGLDIQDGALDAGLQVRLKGEQGANINTSLVFTNLAMSEPEGGFLQRTLALPIALDSALFLLRNQDGEHRVSTNFDVDRDGISAAQIAAAGTSAFAEVIARALGAIPLRLLSNLVPVGNDDGLPAASWSVPFAAGVTVPDALHSDAIQRAALLLEGNPHRVLVLRHELTAEDLAQAEKLANPSAETCFELVKGLRQRKAELQRTLAAHTTETYTLYAIGDPRAARASELLRGYERELATLEDAQDHLLHITRSDSPRQREKRTRRTAREIANQRLEAIQALLHHRLQSPARTRIEIIAPRHDVTTATGGGRVLLELHTR